MSSSGLAACVLLLAAAALRSQCATHWLSGSHPLGTDGVVVAMTTWDPDGPGPMPARLVVGGDFANVEGVPAQRIAVCDLTTGTWSPMGSGMNSGVSSLVTLPGGDLIAGGDFWSAGGVIAEGLARWNGTQWSAITTVPSAYVLSLLTLPNGHLVAGAWHGPNGPIPNCVARWDGTNWFALGAGMPGGSDSVMALTVLANGDLVAGGAFVTAGGVTANNIARWDGTDWWPMGAGFVSAWPALVPVVTSLATLANGDVVAGGQWGPGIGTTFLQRWNGASWSSMGLAPGDRIDGLLTMPNGDLVVAGRLTVLGGVTVHNIARWDGTNWSPFAGGLDGEVTAITMLPNGDVMAAGSFPDGFARWHGSAWTWRLPGLASNAAVTCLSSRGNGEVVVGGAFTAVDGVVANHVASWNGTIWSAMGSGLNGSVACLEHLAGDLVVGGAFALAGGAAANNIARWDGATWWPLGAGVNNQVRSTVRLANGDLVAGGDFSMAGGSSANRIARWDGASWWPMAAGSNASVHDLALLANGDLVAAGSFPDAAGIANGVARWNGAGWSPLGSGLGVGVNTLLPLADGELVVGGLMSIAGGAATSRVARWDGSNWSSLSAGMDGSVLALTELPNGDLVAAGSFTTASAMPAHGMARWDGASWSPIDQGMDDQVRALAQLPNGDLLAGGDFLTAGGHAATHLAQLTTTCPAAASPYGTGCAGPGGTLALVADNLPWIASAFRVTASGLGPASLGLAIVSFGQTSPGTPLSLLPIPGPGSGCTLDVAGLDLVGLTAPFAGSSQSYALPIANDPALPGLAFFLQVAEINFGAGWIGTYTTNALAVTVGAF